MQFPPALSPLSIFHNMYSIKENVHATNHIDTETSCDLHHVHQVYTMSCGSMKESGIQGCGCTVTRDVNPHWLQCGAGWES
jgi:hypothetical protein